MSLGNIFNIAKSSLFAHQQALAITSTNLANADNSKYSRQVVTFGTTSPDSGVSFTFGTGVKVSDVVSARNKIIDNHIRLNNQSYYSANKKSELLQQVESMFSEPSEYGVSSLLTEFFNSWDELAVNPTSTSLRTSVIQSAENLSDKIKSIYDGISQTKLDVQDEAENTVDTVNNLLKEINTVNKQIYTATVGGGNSNELVDTREALIDELSQYVSINVSYDNKNVANISIGGMFAADGVQSVEFSLVQDGDELSLMTSDKSASATLSGGELKGLIDLYNKDLPSQLDTLTNFATTLMNGINTIHEQGYTITDPPTTGVSFFSGFDNGSLEINQDVLDDSDNIAISSNGQIGNSDIALQLADLQNQEIFDGDTLSVGYTSFVNSVANEINLQQQKSESYSLVLEELNNQKTSYSGVSTDEEMVNVLKYQKSYDAAAKLITVADELLETIINMV